MAHWITREGKIINDKKKKLYKKLFMTYLFINLTLNLFISNMEHLSYRIFKVEKNWLKINFDVSLKLKNGKKCSFSLCAIVTFVRLCLILK